MDRAKIIGIIAEEIGRAVVVVGTIDESTDLLSLEIDSLDQMLLVADIEDAFDIEINGIERIDFVTVGDIASAVERSLGREVRLAA